MRENETSIQIYDGNTDSWSMFTHCRSDDVQTKSKRHSYADVSTTHTNADDARNPYEANDSAQNSNAEWQEFFDGDSNRPYYYNFQTEETVWELPDEVDMATVITLEY
eukprot:CAMPEP_0204874742 /NCGR_PEP_ID=MMETSP1348-20121228/43949_1 /ASSEMBLY_ACC=CAM_ASM_000700 /TAXON_ID=215587 /ORGANISM="Aplanochytrium stocchinoi, Strain GSBS06" /LENGTH=107 /DNA_ID=CAMNT_0052030733 /DNA_START=45 /DNA_END=368 /DNA_ORIENTATION=+